MSESGENSVLAFAMSRFNSEADALNWYRTQKPMPGYGDKTPEELVREGFGEELLQTIKAVDAGDIHW
ncbi:MAG: hypothetical protein ACYYKD_09235 [Rhodospirillales bacterium]